MLPVERVEKAVRQWAKELDISLTDTSFYSQEDWAKRKERFGNQAEVSITTEGELNLILTYGTYPHARDSFYELIEKLGYWFELGYSWSIHLYKPEV